MSRAVLEERVAELAEAFLRKRGYPALFDGAATGSGLRSSNCGKKERTACTIGSATRLSPETGRSSGYHPDNRRHTHRVVVCRVGDLDERHRQSPRSASPNDLPSVRLTMYIDITGVTMRCAKSRNTGGEGHLARPLAATASRRNISPRGFRGRSKSPGQRSESTFGIRPRAPWRSRSPAAAYAEPAPWRAGTWQARPSAGSGPEGQPPVGLNG